MLSSQVAQKAGTRLDLVGQRLPESPLKEFNRNLNAGKDLVNVVSLEIEEERGPLTSGTGRTRCAALFSCWT